MHNENCKCPHHWVVKILMLLVWVAGVVFFWSGLKGIMVWGYDPLFYAWSVVVLSLMMFSCKVCGCCCDNGSCGSCKACKNGKMNSKMCSHQSDCKCGDCEKCV